MYKLSEDHEYKICNDTEEYIIDSEVPVKVVIENNKVIAYLDIDGTIFNFGNVIIMEDESYAIDFYRFSKNEKIRTKRIYYMVKINQKHYLIYITMRYYFLMNL